MLWCLIQTIQRMNREAHIVLYTGQQDVMAYNLLQAKVKVPIIYFFTHSKKHFNIDFLRSIEIVGLSTRDWIEKTGYASFKKFYNFAVHGH